MDKATFWKLIDASRKAADGDAFEQIDKLTTLLSELDEVDILAFDAICTEYHNRAYTWDLWGAAYIIGGGCSDDGFSDFRDWLISRGEKAYEAAMKDPESLVRVVTDEDDDCQVQGISHVACEVWETKTGKGFDEYPNPALEYPQEPAGERWDEDDLEERYPKLSAKFM